MLKKDPGKYSFSSVGIGTTGHLSAELIALKSATKMVHVPCKSTPEAMQAVITGEVDLATLTVNLAAPMILADKVTEIAITSAQRWPTLPDVPTISEGIPEMPVDAWFACSLPRGRRRQSSTRSRARYARSSKPRCGKRIEGVHYRPAANTPENSPPRRQEQVTWKRVVDALGLRPQ